MKAKSITRRIENLEERLHPRGKRLRPDEEEEKDFFEVIERFRLLLGMREGQISFFLKLFEIEKEQARKENRHLETWWNVIFLVSGDPNLERIRFMCGCSPLSEEHTERVKELFADTGHPMAESI